MKKHFFLPSIGSAALTWSFIGGASDIPLAVLAIVINATVVVCIDYFWENRVSDLDHIAMKECPSCLKQFTLMEVTSDHDEPGIRLECQACRSEFLVDLSEPVTVTRVATNGPH